MDEKKDEKNCAACRFSGIDIGDDGGLICGHADAGFVGTYAHRASDFGGHCGPMRPKFEQHPHRNEDGSLKEPA